jgi:hypothetical protein
MSSIELSNTIAIDSNGTVSVIDHTLAKSQAFFHALALEIRKPSYGVLQKDFASALLLRAQEAQLYVPEE